MVEGTIVKAQPITGGKRESERGRGNIHGNVVEGTIVKAQPISGGWGFERGKENFYCEGEIFTVMWLKDR